MTFDPTRNAISSPASADGPSQLDWLDGETPTRSGPDPVPASHSAPPESDSPTVIRAISGPCSPASSRSAALQESLENRLRQRLADYGSPEYERTWRHWDMPSGPRICALRASPRRTPVNDCGGWPTPTRQDGAGSRRATARMDHWTSNTGTTLTDAAWLTAGWVTPSSRDWKDTPGMAQHGTNPDGTLRMRLDQLPRQAAIAGYPTPSHSDGSKDVRTVEGARAEIARGKSPRLGAIAVGSLAQTGKQGALNPELSRWLQGYPATWSRCAPTETASSLKRRRKC